MAFLYVSLVILQVVIVKSGSDAGKKYAIKCVAGEREKKIGCEPENFLLRRKTC